MRDATKYKKMNVITRGKPTVYLRNTKKAKGEVQNRV